MQYLRMVEFNNRAIHLVDEKGVGRATVQLKHDQVYPVSHKDRPSLDWVDGIQVITLDRLELKAVDVIYAIYLINRNNIGEDYAFVMTECDVRDFIAVREGILRG